MEPTPADRDGKPHTMEVQVKGIGKVVKRTFAITGEDRARFGPPPGSL